MIDGLVKEPLGGAHRDMPQMAENLKETLSKELDTLLDASIDSLLKERYRRLMAYGKFAEA